jgi:hypothetical protein
MRRTSCHCGDIRILIQNYGAAAISENDIRRERRRSRHRLRSLPAPRPNRPTPVDIAIPPADAERRSRVCVARLYMAIGAAHHFAQSIRRLRFGGRRFGSGFLFGRD